MLKKIFQDKQGRVVIAQKPNLPIIVWAVARLMFFLPFPSTINSILSLLAFGALFTWAWLEIFDGVNIFRRILGATVMAVLIIFGV